MLCFLYNWCLCHVHASKQFTSSVLISNTGKDVNTHTLTHILNYKTHQQVEFTLREPSLGLNSIVTQGKEGEVGEAGAIARAGPAAEALVSRDSFLFILCCVFMCV